MTDGRAICFTGIDGAGKTSHALTLMKELEKRGIAYDYVWARWFPGFADPFHFVVRKTLGRAEETYRFYKPLRIVYQSLVFLDHVFPLFFKVKLPVMMGRCVIIDRYVYDKLADLYFAGLDPSMNSLFGRLFIAMNARGRYMN